MSYQSLGSTGNKSSTSANGLQSEDQCWQPASSSLPAIWGHWPLPYKEDTETHNAGISSAICSLDNSLVHLEGVASPPLQRIWLPLRIPEKTLVRKPTWDKFPQPLTLAYLLLHPLSLLPYNRLDPCATWRQVGIVPCLSLIPKGLSTELGSWHQLGNKHISPVPQYLNFLHILSWDSDWGMWTK